MPDEPTLYTEYQRRRAKIIADYQRQLHELEAWFRAQEDKTQLPETPLTQTQVNTDYQQDSM